MRWWSRASKAREVFTLDGAEHAYRVLIESMNEGALTLTADKVILYANQCFATNGQMPAGAGDRAVPFAAFSPPKTGPRSDRS